MGFDINVAESRPDVCATFEEYLHWGKITRQDERAADKALREVGDHLTFKSAIQSCLSGPGRPREAPKPGLGDQRIMLSVSEQEFKAASRAMRTASWSAVFYLITTDVLGPYSTAWAFAHMGYGPGAALFTVFGILASYSGWIIWKIFLSLDSDRYPLRSWGDMFLRIFGRRSQRIVNWMLTFQLMLWVSIYILQCGQSISQISQGFDGQNGNGLCFVACMLLFMAAGFIVGQIRTLDRFAWIANFSVWTNVVIMGICMGVVARYPPNFKATQASFGKEFGPGPVRTFVGIPPDSYPS
ncbi:hypothetical protein CDD83_8551 [Cordyceps sp. RAO-2017]|nr:hypothetical protein CDD83_8551 [Cordyceps sp. RAO-2017]